MNGDFFSASWWFSAVVLSIVLNLASNYLKPPLDALLSLLSRRWKERSARQAAEYEEKIRLYAKNPHLLHGASMELNHSQYRALVLFLTTMLLFAFSSASPEGLRGTGFIRPPDFITIIQVKQIARFASLVAIFFWASKANLVSRQRRFIKDVEFQLLLEAHRKELP
jgi:hypothetical protein